MFCIGLSAAIVPRANSIVLCKSCVMDEWTLPLHTTHSVTSFFTSSPRSCPVYKYPSTPLRSTSTITILEREKREKMAAAGGDDVKLIGSSPSPYVIRARIALNLKGVDYEFLQENFNSFSGGKSELLLKSNPVYKKVPVLLHNGHAISESMIIVEYIDQVWAHSSILPSDPYERAVSRFWAHYIDDKLFPAVWGTGMGPTEEARAESAAALLAALALLEEAFEKSSKVKVFFGGEGIGYLDIALGSQLGWVKAVSKMSRTEFLDAEKTPLLVAWVERFCADAAVKEVMPETDKVLEFANVLRAKFSSGPAPGK